MWLLAWIPSILSSVWTWGQVTRATHPGRLTNIGLAAVIAAFLAFGVYKHGAWKKEFEMAIIDKAVAENKEAARLLDAAYRQRLAVALAQVKNNPDPKVIIKEVIKNVDKIVRVEVPGECVDSSSAQLDRLRKITGSIDDSVGVKPRTGIPSSD